MQTHSVENRFIVIVFAALLVFVAPLFALFYFLSAERALHERQTHAEVTMMANAQALGKPLWDFDVESVRKIAATIVSDGDIAAVRVRDTSGEIDLTLPDVPAVSENELHSMNTTIDYNSIDGSKTVGHLTITLRDDGFFSTIDRREITFMGIFTFAVLTVFAAAIVANRITIIRPLLRLTEAVVATRNLGSRHRVDWVSSDEMGVLARNFNEMQTELEREESELRSAHAMVQNIYNQTPAMLYSLDDEGKVSAVSDYWLIATGYRREEVLGRQFEEFINPAYLAAYEARPKPTINGASTPGVTVRFNCLDGDHIDVLIRETATRSQTGRQLSLSVMTDVTELKDAENRNHLQAITDHLTGLLNRQGFEDAMDQKIAEADKNGNELACLFVDLDRFKWINDNLGHATGDAVLCEVVTRLRGQLRPTDTVARLGGDEFAILVPANKVANAAEEIAKRIITSLEQPFVVGSNTVGLGASVGIALYPVHAGTASELLQKADMAMYARKRNGKNGTEFFNDALTDMARVHAEMVRDIASGLANDWFEAWMQPIMELGTGRTVGFEALMRLNHPVKGIMPPADIIAAAEENGTIQAIGDVVLNKALQNIARIGNMPGLEASRVGINISPLQINADLPARFSRAMLENNVDPSRVVLEITEAVLMRDDPEIYSVLHTLSDSGMKVALDDFGSGYSSLSYLHRFPVDVIKIDKSFIQALTPDSEKNRDKSYLLVEGITTIAHQIGCDVVAEGIEDEKVNGLLTELGINFGQGYYFAKPMNMCDVEAIYGASEAQQRAISS